MYDGQSVMMTPSEDDLEVRGPDKLIGEVMAPARAHIRINVRSSGLQPDLVRVITWEIKQS